MPGKAPREKGNRLERLIVAILTAAGLDAKRVPLSGSMRGFKGDVVCTILGQPLKIEAKSRRKGFEFIYNALGQNDCLVIKTDRSDPLIIMPLRRFTSLIGKQNLVQCQTPSRTNVDTGGAYDLSFSTSMNEEELAELKDYFSSSRVVVNAGKRSVSLDASLSDVSRETLAQPIDQQNTLATAKPLK